MKRKIKYRSTCCNAVVIFDASADWCEDAQEFAWRDNYDHTPVCEDCGEECNYRVLDLRTDERLEEALNHRDGFIPFEEARAQWASWREQRQKDRLAEIAEEKAMQTAKQNAEILALAMNV